MVNSFIKSVKYGKKGLVNFILSLKMIGLVLQRSLKSKKKPSLQMQEASRDTLYCLHSVFFSSQIVSLHARIKKGGLNSFTFFSFFNYF